MCYFRLHKDGHGRVDLFSLPSLLTSQMDHSHQRRSRDAQCSSSPWCCLYFSAIKTPTENIPKMITKYWSAKRTGSALHQTTQRSLSVCKCFTSEQRKTCAKPKLHAQERLLQVSESQKWEDEWFVPFLLFIEPLYRRIPTINCQGWCPHSIPIILWQSDVSIIPKSHFPWSCC